MASKGKIEREFRNQRLVNKYQDLRNELRVKVKDKKLSLKERMQAAYSLGKLPRNGSAIRLKNRCFLTGSSKSYYRTFGLCRIALREQASAGNIPGFRRSSW